MVLQLHSFLTSALVGGEWSPLLFCHLPLVKEFQVPIEYKIGWAPEAVWMFRTGDYSLAPARSQILYHPVCCVNMDSVLFSKYEGIVSLNSIY